jgi:arabinofuranosyltransferase
MNPDPIQVDAGAAAGRGGKLLAALLLAACGAMLWWHARQLQFFCDDSYISYRYSQNFAAGHGLVYNVGERIEGYTNFLWVVMLGGLMKLGLAVEPASLWLGVAFLIGALALTFVEGRRLFASAAFAAVPVALLVCQGPIVLWSISGLESSCFAAMTLAAILVFERGVAANDGRRLFAAGALYAISTMVRPDGVVFGAAAGLSLALASVVARPFDLKGALRRGLALALGFAALFGPFVLWRHSYYDGEWLPNTFYVKAGGRANAELGLAYFAAWLHEYPLTAALALLGLLTGLLLQRWKTLRPTFLHFALAIALFCVYVIWAGGDYMALYRFVVPLLPLCALLGTAALVSAFDGLARVTAPRLPRPVLAAVALLLLAGGGYVLWFPSARSIEGVDMSKGVRTVKGMRSNTFQWVVAGKAIHDQLPADITIATTAAGALPYFAGQRCIDQSGLCDRYTAKVESDPWFLDRAGHMKQATRKHLAELRPEAIFWHPMIEKPDKAPGYSPPTPDYELRALRVPRLEEEGRALWFWARKDVADAWKGRGVITKEEAKSVIKAARGGDDEGTKGAAAKPAGGSGASGANNATGGAGKVAANAANANGPAPRPASGPADYTVPRPASGRFLTRRLHEIDPTADELRASVDDVTRPLWGASGGADVTLSGLAGSVIEFELASTGSETILPGVRTPTSVELRFESGGSSLELPLQPLPPTSLGARAWKRFRADASAAKGSGRLALKVDGAPAGAGSSWMVSSPRVLDTLDSAARRNVVIVTIDTLRADYLGCYGHDRPTSPNIDVLAKSSVLFERCVSQASWTLPSYSSIFTGLFCETHGVVRRDNKLGFAQVTFIEELAKAGYATGGIASGTFTDSFWGFDQGFDDYDDLGMVVDESDPTGSHARGGVNPIDPKAMKGEGGPEQRITSEEVAQKAMHWLDAHRDRRFCLFAHFFDPHDKWVEHSGISEHFPPRPVGPDFPNPGAAHDEATDRLRALYEGEIAYTDQWIGKLLEHLSTLGMWDDTIVVVCADHGEEFKERGDDDERNVTHGSSLFNEQVHVPLIVHVPGTAPKRVTGVVGNLDLGPTLLELTATKPGAEWRPQGRSLVAMLGDAHAQRGEPVLSAMYRAYIEKTTPEVRVQMAHRVDRGDDAAIEYNSLGPNKVGARFIFDWIRNPLQDLHQDLGESMKAKLDELLDLYHTLAPSLTESAKETSAVEINATQDAVLRGLGYVQDPAQVGAPQIPVAPAPNGDPNAKSDPADAKKDGDK